MDLLQGKASTIGTQFEFGPILKDNELIFFATEQSATHHQRKTS